MKKVLLFMIAVLTISSASAQFQVQAKKNHPEMVWRSAMGGHNSLWIQKDDKGEDCYFIAMGTSNQYDDKLILYLGDKSNSKATFAQLINDLCIQGETYLLKDYIGESFSISFNAFNQYVIRKKGYAGASYLGIGQIEKMLLAIDEQQ